MKCKYCQAELEEGMTVCPACGKEQEDRSLPAQEPAQEVTEAEAPAEEAPAQEAAAAQTEAAKEAKAAAPEIKEGIKATPGKIALAVAAGVVMLALLVALVVSGIDGAMFQTPEETEAPTEATVVMTEPAETVPAGTVPPDGNPEDVTCKGSYSASEVELAAAHDTVVAVCGDQELTVGQLQIYYWECIYAFDSEWGSYASLLGLDYNQGLDTQLCEAGDVSWTWQQYFLDYALNTWHTHQAMALAGEAAQFELPEEYRAELDALPDQLAEMASYYGYADSESWLRDYIGPGCTVEDYLQYMSVYYHGYAYLESLEQQAVFTAEEVEAYFAENEEAYAASGITKDSGKTVDVRHVLLMPENGTTGEDGYPVYSDEDWAACEAQAQALYDQWLLGDLSEESFADLAVANSQDGNASTGGIYEDVTQGYMVETFDAWCFDETRQSGDHGLVKTPYGYHIMYFVGSRQIWYATAEADMISEQVSAAMPAAMEAHPMNVDYSKILLGQLDLVNG